MKTVKTAKELGLAIKNKEDYIYVEGDLKNKVIRIKATGKLHGFSLLVVLLQQFHVI